MGFAVILACFIVFISENWPLNWRFIPYNEHKPSLWKSATRPREQRTICMHDDFNVPPNFNNYSVIRSGSVHLIRRFIEGRGERGEA